MDVLGYLPKSKRNLVLAFDAYFLHDIPSKCSLFNTHQLTKFQCHTFLPSEDTRQNV